MKKIKLFFSFLFLIQILFCFSQQNDDWVLFYNQDSTKVGYKDKNGTVKIEPKFDPNLATEIFRNVIAVSEKISDDKWSNYYLNKKGKKFGIDSVYVFDFTYAEENEGKIKFRDYKTEKVGFFDVDGKVVIPAMYDEAKDFNKNLCLVLTEGVRMDKKGGDHYNDFVGGRSFMINSKNQILFEIEDFFGNYSLDFTNAKINENVDSEVYNTFKSNDGNTYSFYSPEKDFKKWLETKFLPDFKKNKKVLPQYFYELISVDDYPKGQTAWTNHQKQEYLKSKRKLINHIFNQVISKKYSASISWEKGNNYLYFPENIKPKEDLSKNYCIEYLPRNEKDSSGKNTFQFTKIGNDFYITSAP